MSTTFTVSELEQTPWVPLERLPAGTKAVRSDRGVEVIAYDTCAATLRNLDYSTGLVELFDASGVDVQDFKDIAAKSLNYVEGPDHARLRAALGTFFTPQKVQSMRGDVRRWIEDALDAVEGRTEIELVDEMIRRVPARVFSELLGVDADLHGDFISRISEESVRIFEMDPELAGPSTRAWTELTGWIDELLEIHTPGEPTSNVLDHMLAQQAAGNMSEEDIRVSLVTLLAASTDTTQILAGLMFTSFADNPDQWERLRNDPSLASSAVTEAARYRPGDAWIFRVATKDNEIAGVPVEKGEHVFVLIGAAHRDPDVFSSPNTFDIGRSGERLPMNWGVGRHFCLGRMFAVMELEEMLLATSSRWSTLSHADPIAAGEAGYLDVQHRLPVRVTYAN